MKKKYLLSILSFLAVIHFSNAQAPVRCTDNSILIPMYLIQLMSA